MHISRVLNPPGKSFFLMGPRGTGKSTWLKAVFSKAVTFDLLDEEVFQRLLAAPGLFQDELRRLIPGSWVVVDEIQRLPDLLNEVHKAIEEQQLHFVLCGSSARKLKRAGVNLLAGRALHRSMHSFIPEELGVKFKLDDAIRFGLLPIVFASEDREETLKAYTRLYLKEEIQAEALIRNLPGFARFLPIAALLHGNIVNVSNVAREARVARTTTVGFFEILEDTLVCFYLPAFEAKLRMRERKLAKLYWCDPGLVRALKNTTGIPSPEEYGILFEGFIAQLIRSYRDYRNLCDEFYYWAPIGRTQTEVNFLLRRNDKFIAIEVKSGRQFSEGWCKGLRVIKALGGIKRRLVVYPKGPGLTTKDGIEIVPFAEFSDLLARDALWP